MPNAGDFSSLLQLGAGVGLALSTFTTPLSSAITHFEEKINRELRILLHQSTPLAQEKISSLNSLSVEFESVKAYLHNIHIFGFWLAAFGALVNLSFLLYVTHNVGQSISVTCEYIFYFFSSLYFILLISFLKYIATSYLSPLHEHFSDIKLARKTCEIDRLMAARLNQES
jgi:hypothetical protein